MSYSYVYRSNGETEYEFKDLDIEAPTVVSCTFPIEKGVNLATRKLEGGGLHLDLYKL